ncbi:ubiquitin-conjugating enzyme/RWD-like protein [Thelonectria olida]|uniref:Ubiquitin-conjugating enzyme E2 2 n=1 Tax=Thelonectria olida TaxID=1576542 RepID=A0A9P8W5E8_9HYPO|nr:ubiquitin-conjugating enzyme/RWD-like protein [Thelonectria olida]
MSREKRLLKELADIQADRDNSGVYASAITEEDVTHLKGTIPAPPDTPYAGGTYVVDIQIPAAYPFKAPVIKFDTKIWHPNVSSQTGAICLDTLGSGWSPVQTIKTALLSLRMLLEVPNPKDPQDAEVAKMLLVNPEAFARKAHEWAVLHAGAPQRDVDLSKFQNTTNAAAAKDDSRYNGYNKDLVDRFVNMGFDVEEVVAAFLFVGIDRHNGQDYDLEEAYMGDITARLLGEH